MICSSMRTRKLSPIHPGEILRVEFMKPRGLSQNALARALNVPPRRINEIVLQKRGITADTALRLGVTSAQRRKCGRVCRRITTCGWPVMTSKSKSNGTCNRWRRDPTGSSAESTR